MLSMGERMIEVNGDFEIITIESLLEDLKQDLNELIIVQTKEDGI